MHRASHDLTDPDRNLAESVGQTPNIPEDVDLDLLAGQSNGMRFHTPPPRIAERFYRPTNNRRKSSAASSRRGSISSAHSHQSHASGRGGPQSSYIAQHLRRASILEDRKARLADRAAHAEKVRLRAALAKAAPRGATNSEERALAARQAREKNLAEIVASCAEEVKRAKGIAESMKEKREAEGKKLRREMEERLAEAERRREEILNKGGKRARSVSQPRKTPSPARLTRAAITEPAAAAMIQRQWRIHRRGKALKDFADLGLTVDSVRETSFEDVVDLLAQEKVLITTAHLLRICGLKEGESGSVNEMTAVRTFLSAFLILGHPTQVLSSKGEKVEEQANALPMSRDDPANPQDLVGKARDLLISFENVLSRLNTSNNYTPPPVQLTTLSEAYATFFNAFIAWKARDSSTLIDMMVLQFVELDSIWQTVKDSTEEFVSESYRDGIRENQLKLMVRIKKLAGAAQGKRLITNAIREARRARAAKKPAGDARPRAAESDAAVVPDLTASERSVASHLQTLTPPATPVRNQGTHADELRSAMSVLPDNRTLVHELSINREYRIEAEDCLEQRGALNKIIFDSMRQDVAAGNSDTWVLAMAANIKGRLQRLLKEGNSMYTLIGEVLDTDVVSRELQSGSFSYDKFFSFMATLLPRLCAPFRDAEVKTLTEVQLQDGDVVTRLQALLGFIDLMHLDYANFMLQQSAPELLKHALPYESQRFSEIMEEASDSLPATEAAWRVARNTVMTEAARRDPENVNLARAQPTPDKIYVHMLVDVFTSVDGSVGIPETLQLDAKRIARTRTEILRIVTTGAILLQSKNLLKRDVRSQWKTEAARVYAVLEHAKSPEPAIHGTQTALESLRSMPAATKAHMRDIVARMVAGSAAAAAGHADLRDPVMRLLLTRLRAHVLARLAAGTDREKLRSASTASESLASLGLPEFVHRVGRMVDEMARVGAIDRQAHGPWYEDVALKIEGENAAGGEGPGTGGV
jgi:hypothetical protein